MSISLVPISPFKPAAQDPNASLRKHVAEFEGLLLSQILQKLKDAYHLPGEEEGDSAGESFHSLANSALGNNLAARGGLGMTNLLIQSLTNSAELPDMVKPKVSSADINPEVDKNH